MRTPIVWPRPVGGRPRFFPLAFFACCAISFMANINASRAEVITSRPALAKATCREVTMTEEAHTTNPSATVSRRTVLTGIAAFPSAAVPLSSMAAEDPIVPMLRRRNAMIQAYFTLPDDDDVMGPACEATNAFEHTIIGLPILSLTGAALAVDAFRQENCCDALDVWLLEAVDTFLRQAAA